MALRRPPTTFSDEISAADLAANSVGASELADNAVDANAIAANAVTTAKIADSTGGADGITTAKLATDAVTSAKIATGAVIADGIGAGAVVAAGIGAGAVTAPAMGDILETKPHIIPGVLQPAVAGKLLNGATHSGAYGTAQTQSGGDGHSYYYTDLKGSKPIKDPRIGAHFGSQRHRCTSLQNLYQESARNDNKVYTVDGREWVRVIGHNWAKQYGNYGACVENSALNNGTTQYIEVVAYCNAINLETFTAGDWGKIKLISIDGSADSTTQEGFAPVSTPTSGRYLPAGAIIPVKTASLSLGIHTFRLGGVDNLVLYGIELIAQDTTDTTRRNHVLIPAQNVVSYGKKFSIGSNTLTNAAHKHYNPFAFKTDGSTAWAVAAHNGTSFPVGTGSSHNIDTATSLGLEKWKHSSNYYRPYNGGRVVIWVDSAGAIKTSVNVMPPNAKSIKDADISKKANASVANDTYLPTFEANTGGWQDADEDGLNEVTKTFHWSEFGNGSANKGTTSTTADLSMLSSSADDTCYVMEDGCTSLAARSMYRHSTFGLIRNGVGDFAHLSWVGTGLSMRGQGDVSGYRVHNIVQNLPYGNHILKIEVDGSSSNAGKWIVDGVEVKTSWNSMSMYEFGPHDDIYFHQPKRPPIPENATVLADYMLMAEYVKCGHTGRYAGSTGAGSHIGKGVIRVHSTKDHFYETTGNSWSGDLHRSHNSHVRTQAGMTVSAANFTASNIKLSYFGFPKGSCWFADNADSANQNHEVTTSAGVLTGTNVSCDGAHTYTNNKMVMQNRSQEYGITNWNKSDGVLGSNVVNYKGADIDGTNDWFYFSDGSEIVTPIHTSSHYQAFESPYLHELVGGSRNMEQTNLIVTADGKSWDEVTRDTSYIGNSVVQLNGSQGSNIANNTAVQFKLNRGAVEQNYHFLKKYFVMAYDRVICLIEGEYKISYATICGTALQQSTFLQINGTACTSLYTSGAPASSYFRLRKEFTTFLKRGDFIQINGGHWDGTNVQHQQFTIDRLR